MTGANDIERTPIATMVEGVKKIISEIKTVFPKTRIYLFGMLPRIADKIPERKIFERVLDFNSQIAKIDGVSYSWFGDKLLDENNCIIGRFFVDNVHLSKSGYEFFVSEILRVVEE